LHPIKAGATSGSTPGAILQKRMQRMSVMIENLTQLILALGAFAFIGLMVTALAINSHGGTRGLPNPIPKCKPRPRGAVPDNPKPAPAPVLDGWNLTPVLPADDTYPDW
jgi:hypothetical protein